MPFYAAGVAYRQSFAVDKAGGRYKVRVPRWYGSVAKVSSTASCADSSFRSRGRST